MRNNRHSLAHTHTVIEHENDEEEEEDEDDALSATLYWHATGS